MQYTWLSGFILADPKSKSAQPINFPENDENKAAPY
jgi:hypothetical protein